MSIFSALIAFTCQYIRIRTYRLEKRYNSCTSATHTCTYVHTKCINAWTHVFLNKFVLSYRTCKSARCILVVQEQNLWHRADMCASHTCILTHICTYVCKYIQMETPIKMNEWGARECKNNNVANKVAHQPPGRGHFVKEPSRIWNQNLPHHHHATPPPPVTLARCDDQSADRPWEYLLLRYAYVPFNLHETCGTVTCAVVLILSIPTYICTYVCLHASALWLHTYIPMYINMIVGSLLPAWRCFILGGHFQPMLRLRLRLRLKLRFLLLCILLLCAQYCAVVFSWALRKPIIMIMTNITLLL